MRGFYSENECRIEDFKACLAQEVTPAQIPHSIAVEGGVPVYDAPALSAKLTDDAQRRALMAEWAWIFQSGPGAIVLRQAQPDHAAIDEATATFNAIIKREKEAGGEGADHFAAAGSNDRIWNSLQKLAMDAPAVFIRYHASPAIDAACEAWLGPAYQLTAQVNLVHPGGKAQSAHRDYHLGFQTAESCARYPAHVHDLSPLMTLQGALAHCDMPVESGPTKLLPYSQLYKPGYAAMRRPDFSEYFEEHYVQVALEKGDAVFFNPALFHAAGENRTSDIERMANLMQIGSAFGRTLENVDRSGMCLALYEPLRAAWEAQQISEAQLDAVIAASAEGYPFPTNLDTDPPVGGLAPASQAALLRKAMMEEQPLETFSATLGSLKEKQRA